MDLRMHALVIWRWRPIVIVGVVLAIGLAFFSVFRVSFADGYSLRFRQGKIWQSAETLLLSQKGCAVGQITCGSEGFSSSPASAASVAPLYAQIANSGLLRARVLPNGLATAARGNYNAVTVTDGSTGGQQLLPFLEFDGTGSTPAQAMTMARRAVKVFLAYLDETSNTSKIPQSNRVVIQVVSAASTKNANVIQGRKLTSPILVFLAVMIVTFGLAYVLENLFPRPSPAAGSTLTPLTSADLRDESRRDGIAPEAPLESIEPGLKQAAAAVDPTK